MLRNIVRALGALALAASATPLIANPRQITPVTDCPLRDAPFSASAPLIDVMLSPQAKAVLDKSFPGKFSKLPPFFSATTPPTFAAILTIKEASGFVGLKPADIDAADKALRALPVTRADRIARCARYDNDVPLFDLPKGKRHVLLFEKINGFKDVPSFNAAHAMFTAMAARKHFTLVASDKGGLFNAKSLAQFDAVIWNNISGDVLSLSQRKALQAYMAKGGAFIGVHGSAGDPVYFWDWYTDTLLGARFLMHPMSPQFQEARVMIDDPQSPITRGLPSEWRMRDEWYSFKASPRASGAHVLAVLDEATYNPVGMMGMNLRMGDHPIAWTRCVGRGRMFYSAIGHLPETYAEPHYLMMLENAVDWATASKTCAR